MGKYGQASMQAIKLIKGKFTETPIKAWNEATIEIFGKGTSGQIKGCPRNTFLGLCEEGKVKGISSGTYTKSKRNKLYVLRTVEILSDNPTLSGQHDILWMKVLNGETKDYNYQMEVMTVLWENGLIAIK